MSVNCLNSENDPKPPRGDPLLTFLTVLFVIILVVAVGTIGFRIFAEQEWIDAFVNGALVFTSTSIITPNNTNTKNADKRLYMAANIFP
jgi:biotin transporter BioY